MISSLTLEVAGLLPERLRSSCGYTLTFVRAAAGYTEFSAQRFAVGKSAPYRWSSGLFSNEQGGLKNCTGTLS